MSPSPEHLPPFSGDETTCPKCSHNEAHTEYKEAEKVWIGSIEGISASERLERRCVRCDYEWDEALNPPAKDGA
ncbi:hypothetical protein G6W51_17110 [Streptomyces coelicolor]|nr:hypothetical protein [Streptomyces coelicolor]